ncbi:tyrosine-type recombinase/integrase [Dietzia cercidiphylli]|uniref:Tyrosine-type recombinase/integrase n=1 Tax=Dietzia cercidiphylli TaxID=498199 RepID=A0ABP4VCB5_9ACTN|nr:tyrosine-type recombinase/integrase [Dietzia cercidiphylli]MBB1049419.1 tyrosine-type recombinase/integrase [Dietzia cercidiphylli]
MNGLVSGLAAHIQSLLELKHAMGFPYDTSERHLRGFDKLCARDYPDQAVLTRQMAMSWAAARTGEHVNGQMRRITPVRQLAKHMNDIGVEAYVIPTGIPGRQVRYRPHLFTHDQLRAFFDAADAIRPCLFGGPRHLVIPVLFRMMYCLGLRPGEARKLHRNDVDLTSGAVWIRESKGHKDRIVFMSSDLHQCCRSYDATISALHPERIAFFPNHTGAAYSHGTVNGWFRELTAAADPPIAAGPGPAARPYDLRHAHVVENINRWSRAGEDPLARLPYLGLHLGHTNPEDTWYYFHLAADFHPDLRRLANAGLETVLPEACHGLR